MSTEDRRKREQEQRRNQILDAAESIIKHFRFEHATMDDIAAKAELSKGTLYLYFSNKTALYLAINKRGLVKLKDSFQDVLKKDLVGIELINQLGEAYLSFIVTNREYTKAVMYYESLWGFEELQENKYAEECEEVGRQLLMYLTRVIQIGIQDGSVAGHMEPKLLAV